MTNRHARLMEAETDGGGGVERGKTEIMSKRRYTLNVLVCICAVSTYHKSVQFLSGHCLSSGAVLTNVTVASSKTFLALTLVLVRLSVGAGSAVLTRLVSATVVQI